jgi:hypothetical protein
MAALAVLVLEALVAVAVAVAMSAASGMVALVAPIWVSKDQILLQRAILDLQGNLFQMRLRKEVSLLLTQTL